MTVVEDLSQYATPISDLFKVTGPDDLALTPEQLNFFNENGYLAGVRILNESQVAALRKDLAKLMEPEQSKNRLFYEYHHNESTDPNNVLFHALGAWRISLGFHDLLFNRAFTEP